jgi:carbon storage regulator CsrA
MIVFTRKRNESIVIDGGRIVVTLLSADRGRGQVGVTCAKTVTVDREEVHSRKVAEGRAVPIPAAA